MSDREYYLPFSAFSGIGPHKFSKLLKTFGSAEEAWETSLPELKQVLGEKTASKFDDFRKKFDITKFERELKQKKIDYVCLGEKEYPALLSQIPNPPILLYVKGDKSLLNKNSKIAIVGTRKMTGYGKTVTGLFSSDLSQAGMIIVSGLAIGVDAQAHLGCLEAGGKTIAVLGNGVDLPFPSSNAGLYQRILKEGGAIVSEFPPGEPPSKGTFPSRNRIIAGISQGVLVTEGAEDSGSLITANYGLEFKRKVFAVPGPITSSLSAAPLKLIEKGAKLVVSPADVLEELGVSSLKAAVKRAKGDTKDEQRVIDLLQNESLHFDEIVRRLKFDPSKTGTILSMMEIKGILKNQGGSYALS